MSSAQPSLSRSALLRGGSSHPRPFRGRPFARSDDLLAVLRVAVHFAHTRLGRHGILRIGSGELYVRGELAPDELQLLLLRIRAIEEVSYRPLTLRPAQTNGKTTNDNYEEEPTSTGGTGPYDPSGRTRRRQPVYERISKRHRRQSTRRVQRKGRLGRKSAKTGSKGCPQRRARTTSGVLIVIVPLST